RRPRPAGAAGAAPSRRLARQLVERALERDGVEVAVGGLAERGEGPDLARFVPVVDGLATRDAQAPDVPRAVVPVEVAPPRRRYGAAAIDVTPGDGAVVARVAVDLNGPDERAGVVQP